jgi:endonuclease-8
LPEKNKKITMPEGPSIVILKEEAAAFKGKKVLAVSGNSKVGIERLEGQKVVDLKSWGKHFLICFKGFTVRIHLMLFGSYRINERKEAAPRLSLTFANGELNFYTCSVKIIEEPLDEVYDWEVDTMADAWNPKKAKAALKALKNIPVCDALLDQNIFAGSGNIIKNEVLFRIRVHPLTLVENLPAAKLNELVKETPHYCFQFYEWKKKYELRKHWLAYKQKMCPRCHIPFLLRPLGRNKRRTFYCESCQVLYA